MRVFENIVNSQHQDFIEEQVLGTWFPWYYEPVTSMYDGVSGTFIDSRTRDHPMMVHSFIINGNITSSYWNLVAPIIDSLNNYGLNTSKIIRVKSNLVFPQANYPEGFYSAPHIDSDWNIEPRDQYTFLYYINDSDGDTVLFKEVSDCKTQPETLTEETRFSPKKGTGILFNSCQYHSGTPPRKHKARAVINFMFDCR